MTMKTMTLKRMMMMSLRAMCDIGWIRESISSISKMLILLDLSEMVSTGTGLTAIAVNNKYAKPFCQVPYDDT